MLQRVSGRCEQQLCVGGGGGRSMYAYYLTGQYSMSSVMDISVTCLRCDTHTYVRTYVHKYVHVHAVYMYVCMYVHTYVCPIRYNLSLSTCSKCTS